MPHDRDEVRSALFVDFDNIFSGLRELDPRAAERFASNPQSWLDWMVLGLPTPEEQAKARAQRAILIRRCYLNPERFQRHRADFTRAGFEVVDCPPLTRQGKTSTDIRMVMDILDTLRHETYFSEFIILSSDADFTPVLLRLRSMDRRTLVLTVGPSARAYRSACEQVVDEVFFIEAGLGVVAAAAAAVAPEEATPAAPEELYRRMAASLRVETETHPGHEMTAADIPPVYKRFSEFTNQSDWLGFFGLKPLTVHLAAMEPGLTMVDEPDSAWKWKLVRNTTAQQDSVSPPEGIGPEETLETRVAALVQELLREASRPLELATVANLALERLGPALRDSDWVGAGSFTALLRDLNLPGVAVSTPKATSPGYLYDPTRHEPPAPGPARSFEKAFPELAMLSMRVSQVTGTPRLTPPEYRVVFEAIEAELALAPFNLTLISKAVRDRCVESGESVSRSDVVFILRGIQFSGTHVPTDERGPSAHELAQSFARNVVVLCREARMELSEHELEAARDWIAGAMPSPEEPGPVANLAESADEAEALVTEERG